MFFTYLAPLIILSIYFYFQYNALVSESTRLHLGAVAENQANTLDLFLYERLVNLSNLIDDPAFPVNPTSTDLVGYLAKLKSNSETFVDIGYFDASGIQASYAGPYPSLVNRNYADEVWFTELKTYPEEFIITDIYLGFRQEPHFTIAVKRAGNGRFQVLRATLSPEKIYEYITSLEGSHEVTTSLVNRKGMYQVVTSTIGKTLAVSDIVPPELPVNGFGTAEFKGKSVDYAYSRLKQVGWVLIVQAAAETDHNIFTGFRFRILAVTGCLAVLSIIIIISRARKLALLQRETDETRAQLEHAAKLASVGELAAGIAHEINNPLAVISEEAGLMKDFMNPVFGKVKSPEELTEHLDTIQESVFRCRDITRKLLGFVRKTEIKLTRHNIHEIIDSVVDGLLGQELSISNIEVIRQYGQNIPEFVTDANQLQQVLLNIIKNGIDAMGGQDGTITIRTMFSSSTMRVALSDTGNGMTKDQLSKIFLPFFTTKEVGKGTGLGLSVSFSIVKSLGGSIEVSSTPGVGSTFTIILPTDALTPNRSSRE